MHPSTVDYTASHSHSPKTFPACCVTQQGASAKLMPRITNLFVRVTVSDSWNSRNTLLCGRVHFPLNFAMITSFPKWAFHRDFYYHGTKPREETCRGEEIPRT